MWIWKQGAGQLWHGETLVATGYSGFGAGKNSPDAQDQHNVGPIPRGLYVIGPPHNTDAHGPYVLALTPDEGNEMFGRSGFLCHGDSADLLRRGLASQGCIILAPVSRHAIWDSGDHQLIVVA